VLGELVQTTAGKWITHPPTRCPNGHRLGAGQVLVGQQACLGHCGGHTTWTCRACDATVYGPPMNTRTARPSKGARLCGSRPHGTDAKRLARRRFVCGSHGNPVVEKTAQLWGRAPAYPLRPRPVAAPFVRGSGRGLVCQASQLQPRRVSHTSGDRPGRSTRATKSS